MTVIQSSIAVHMYMYMKWYIYARIVDIMINLTLLNGMN